MPSVNGSFSSAAAVMFQALDRDKSGDLQQTEVMRLRPQLQNALTGANLDRFEHTMQVRANDRVGFIEDAELRVEPALREIEQEQSDDVGERIGHFFAAIGWFLAALLYTASGAFLIAGAIAAVIHPALFPLIAFAPWYEMEAHGRVSVRPHRGDVALDNANLVASNAIEERTGFHAPVTHER